VRAHWCGEPIYAAAARWREECLRRDGSLFTPGASVWTARNLAAVQERVGIAEAAGGSFIEKLESQLAGQEPLVVQLGAELLFVQMISEADTHGETAREHIARILGLLGTSLELAGGLDEALDAGGVAGFAAGKAYRDAHVRFVGRLAAQLKALSDEQRGAALDEPWKLREVVAAVRTSTDAMEANAVLHLLFPDTFSYMVAESQRRKLIATFARLPGVQEADSDERRIELIEAAAARHATWKFNLYEDAVKPVWDEPASARWQEAVRWAKRLFESAGFDANEREYKLEIGADVAAARDAVLRGDPGWTDLLRRAFRARRQNLINWQAFERLLEWIDGHAEEARAALEILWRDPDTADPRLTPFLQALPNEAAKGAGTRVSITTFLLLGIDPTRWPFFKPTPYTQLCKILGVAAQPTVEIDPEAVYRPEALAALLGVDGRQVRGFLRQAHPREESERGGDWYLSGEQAAEVVARFGPEADPRAEEAMYQQWWTLLEQLRLRLLAVGTELRDMLDAQSLGWWLATGYPPDGWSTEDKAALKAFAGGSAPLAPGDEPAATSSPPASAPALDRAALPRVTDELAKALHLPAEWLQRVVVDQLERQRQLILYGPPGTGKTYLAQHLGRHIAATGGSFRLVQFHPSYTYEDFFEGYRPRHADGGALSFDLVPGALREIAEQARMDPAHPHLLVIDEINRGNIAKIFGELYFLLEYRDAHIQLQYSRHEQFALPENLYFIGTLNTADRSIALVDSALRRRFYFVGLIPTREPVDRVLRSWLEAHGHDPTPAALLRALNEAIGEDDFAIGPSYLMTRDGSFPPVE
jgi:hypothetical protein